MIQHRVGENPHGVGIARAVWGRFPAVCKATAQKQGHSEEGLAIIQVALVGGT